MPGVVRVFAPPLDDAVRSRLSSASDSEVLASRRVALLCLPPHHITYEANALTHLAEHLRRNSYPVRLRYLNIRFHAGLLDWLGLRSDGELDESVDGYEMAQLLPFLGILADAAGDENAKRQLIARLCGLAPHRRLHFPSYQDFFGWLLRKATKLIDDELARVRVGDVALLGMSSKHLSWIPALVVSERAKAMNPKVKIVVGGWLTADSARDALKLSSCFDFTVWGEGEQSLLELCDVVIGRTREAANVPHLFSRDLDGNIVAGRDDRYRPYDLQRYTPPRRKEFARLVGTPSLPRKRAVWVIDGNRGCSWSKCLFCAGSFGCPYRERSPASKAAEIRWLSRRYGARNFLFADNNMAGDPSAFEQFLDELAEMRHAGGIQPRIFGEVSPTGINARIVGKMARAGIREVQIGYESTSDRILAALGKENRFADNLLFVKLCIRHRIAVVGANVLTNTPGETADVIRESIENLIYLRFCLGTRYFQQVCCPFALVEGSRASGVTDPMVRKRFTKSAYTSLLPESLFSGTEWTYFLARTGQPEETNRALWELFEAVAGFYRKHRFAYDFEFTKRGSVEYTESVEDRVVYRMTLPNHLSYQVLSCVRDQICTMDGLATALASRNVSTSYRELERTVRDLQSHHLVYANTDLSQIVAIVDVPKKSPGLTPG